jgi:hypothetical protein
VKRLGEEDHRNIHVKERSNKMTKSIFIFLCFGIFMVLPNLVLADCTDIGGFTGFSVSGNTVTLYSGNTPFVKFGVQCDIQPTSRLQLIKGYVCDGDEVLVDGSRCTILDVNSSVD